MTLDLQLPVDAATIRKLLPHRYPFLLVDRVVEFEKDKRILATGYNGAPAGVSHCVEAGCLRASLGIPSGERHEICRGLHAEQNVIIQAAVHGIPITGADVYCTTQPCLICAKMLINCGVRRIVFAQAYPDDLSQAMFAEAGVLCEHQPLDPERP